MNLKEMGLAAKKAAMILARAETAQKNQTLRTLAALLLERKSEILAANASDFNEAKSGGMSHAMLDRLSLEGRLEGLAEDVLRIAGMQDPVGQVFEEKTLPNGLEVSKVRTPIGVLGVVYEARPNVTIDIAALAIKTGNAAVLRGGSETLRTNKALVGLIKEALEENKLPPSALQFIENTDRALVREMLALHQYIDVIIPRGGSGLHQFCRENSRIPVITGGIGICHLYVDETADLEEALLIIQNAKVQRPTVCNALDTALVHRAAARSFLPMLAKTLHLDGVSFRMDKESEEILREAKALGDDDVLAQSDDWDTEWLSLILGVKVVSSLEEAIAHITLHSTGHSDGILTKTPKHADFFVQAVDSAAVYVNASTRFTDGSQLGLGAEVAISTQKLHARGPMGLPELTSYKWVVRGKGHVRP